MKLAELAQRIGAEMIGDGTLEITGVNSLEEASAGQVSFLAHAKYLPQLETTQASAVIVAPGVESARLALLRTGDPYYAFAQALVALRGHRKHPHAGIHPRANVDPTATVGEATVVYPGAYVGPRVRIGRDCIIYPNAVIYDECVLGDRVIVHANAVIGQDGYGYAPHGGVHHKIPQVGNVVLEDDVEIGANCAVARAALGHTVIGRGTKLDALVMVGHNVQTGEHCLLVAHVGIAGSTTMGHHVTLAGQVGVAGHAKIGNNVTVGAQSGIHGEVPDQSILLGSPALPISQTRRVWAVTAQLPELLKRLKQLERQVGEMTEK